MALDMCWNMVHLGKHFRTVVHELAKYEVAVHAVEIGGYNIEKCSKRVTL